MSRLTCLRDDFGPVGKFDRVYNECRRLIIELELGAREKHGAEVLEEFACEFLGGLIDQPAAELRGLAKVGSPASARRSFSALKAAIGR